MPIQKSTPPIEHKAGDCFQYQGVNGTIEFYVLERMKGQHPQGHMYNVRYNKGEEIAWDHHQCEMVMRDLTGTESWEHLPTPLPSGYIKLKKRIHQW